MFIHLKDKVSRVLKTTLNLHKPTSRDIKEKNPEKHKKEKPNTYMYTQD